jgi:hypothetical protein
MSSSSTRGSNELLDRYLNAVRFWLPDNRQQGDILAELGEDLRSQFEEKQAELGHPLDETEAAAILKACGSPMAVASRYQPQRYLIGPALFPIYKFVLKMVLLWILVPVFLFIVGPVSLMTSAGSWGEAAVRTLGGLWWGLCIAGAVITLIFAVLEGTRVQLGLENKWDPRSLPPVTERELQTSFLKTICEFAFATVGLVWLLLLPRNPFLILGPAAAFLKPAPMWNTFYPIIVALAAVNIVRLWVGLLRPQWRWFLPLTHLLNNGLSLLVLYFILSAALHASAAGWSPFVVLSESTANAVGLVKVAAVVNLSILVALAGTWVGLAIAGPIETWRFMRNLRRGTFPAPRGFSCNHKATI